jgi:D-sedoheptulose 7-phosphate isomerase
VSRRSYLERYLAEGTELLRSLPVAAIDRVVEVLIEAQRAERFIYVMGNGGSAANAEHFVNDLGKGEGPSAPRRFKIMSLTSNVSLLTAWANDTDYEHIFAEQLRNFVQPGDVVMALSGSGNSRNVVNAIALGRERGAVTVGLTGFEGGKLKDLCDHCILVSSHNMQHIEAMHLVVLHAIYSAIRDT